MTLGGSDRRVDTYFVREGHSLANLKYKQKERSGRFREIDEKTTPEEYTLDWSQSKVFLVIFIQLGGPKM